MRVFIIDDEKAARELLKKKLKEIRPDLQISSFGNPLEAIAAIQEEKPDVVFLDVQMPEMDGFELLDQLNEEQRCFSLVFCTAYSEYGVKAFEEAAIDYLLKPVNIDRLRKTIDRLEFASQEKWKQYVDHRQERNFLERLSVKVRGVLKLIQCDRIALFCSESHETIVRVNDGKEYISNFSLDTLEKKLDPSIFIRTHRSFIVNINCVAGLNSDRTQISFCELDEIALLSKRRKSFFLEAIKSRS